MQSQTEQENREDKAGVIVCCTVTVAGGSSRFTCIHKYQIFPPSCNQSRQQFVLLEDWICICGRGSMSRLR